jgi:hypothetical protein
VKYRKTAQRMNGWLAGWLAVWMVGSVQKKTKMVFLLSVSQKNDFGFFGASKKEHFELCIGDVKTISHKCAVI